MTKSAVAALENTEKESLLKTCNCFFHFLLSGRASSEVSCTSRKVRENPGGKWAEHHWPVSHLGSYGTEEPPDTAGRGRSSLLPCPCGKGRKSWHETAEMNQSDTEMECWKGLLQVFMPGVELILPLEGRDELKKLSKGLPAHEPAFGVLQEAVGWEFRAAPGAEAKKQISNSGKGSQVLH